MKLKRSLGTDKRPYYQGFVKQHSDSRLSAKNMRLFVTDNLLQARKHYRYEFKSLQLMREISDYRFESQEKSQVIDQVLLLAKQASEASENYIGEVLREAKTYEKQNMSSIFCANRLP